MNRVDKSSIRSRLRFFTLNVLFFVVLAIARHWSKINIPVFNDDFHKTYNGTSSNDPEN